MTKLTHVIEAQQFSKEWLEKDFFPLAEKMKKISKTKGKKILAGKEMISFFYEPSTRTRLSFELAMRRLGGEVIFSTDHAKEFSSAAKGETIEDTVRILGGYEPDVIVLRTDEEGMAKRAAECSAVSIINAGDGTGQHPTQALLDIYTIKDEIGKIEGTTIAMVGDLARGRTVRSLAYLYSKFPKVKIYFVSPDVSKMRNDVKEYLARNNVRFEELDDLRKVAGKVDIIYSTRVQKERGGSLPEANSFCAVNREILNVMKKDAIIMHPLPRVDEIAPEVDKDPRAAYFRQAKNGLFVRMALLKMILE